VIANKAQVNAVLCADSLRAELEANAAARRASTVCFGADGMMRWKR
jgi:2-aminobenzoate-CoA ligase